mgnify:CR=1 FL=1|jgi:polar amino acid transport system substrate-binding protein
MSNARPWDHVQGRGGALPEIMDLLAALNFWKFPKDAPMTKRFWLLCLIVAMASPVVMGIARMAGAAETLTIAADITPPFSNAEKSGFDDRLIKEIFRRIGYAVAIQNLPSERVLINANDGLLDGTQSRIGGMSEKYPNLVQLEERSREIELVAFTRMSNLEIVDWTSLAPYHVGIVTGWKILEWNIKQSKSLIKVGSAEQLFKMLDARRIDVAVYARWPGLQLIGDLGFKNIRVVDPPFATRDLFAYLHKRHARLIPKASEALRAMKADGSYQRIHDQTLGALQAK